MRKIVPLLLCLMLSSCGVFKKQVSSEPSYRQENIYPAERVLLYPKDYEPVRDSKDVPEIVPYKSAVHERKEMTFSGLETEHVRVKGVNPIPDDYLLMNLDDLATEFCYPYDGKFISDYGMRGRSFHTGVDIKCIPNDTIRAAFPGVVRMSKDYSTYGNIVVIRHYAGFETVYSHNSRNLVRVNEHVVAGQPIALAGRTGRASTEHLHFEIRAAGHHFDPKMVIDCNERSIRSGVVHLKLNDGQLFAYRSDRELEGLEEKIREEAARKKAEDALIAARVEAQAKAAPAATTGRVVYHTVKKGDTLSAIARRHSTTVARICQLNGIKSTKVLQINEKLRVK